jgi:hypothetical protein
MVTLEPSLCSLLTSALCWTLNTRCKPVLNSKQNGENLFYKVEWFACKPRSQGMTIALPAAGLYYTALNGPF